MIDKPSLHQFRKLIKTDKYEDVVRIYYCYQIGSAFLSLGLLETNLISAMAMCSKIDVSRKFGNDAGSWDDIVKKHENLKNSTIGSLISIIEKSASENEKIGYLRYLKSKRDYFIHRLYHIGPWPGDLRDEEVVVLCRRLLYLDHIFRRGAQRVFPLFAELGLLKIIPLGEDGSLMMDVDAVSQHGSWIQELAIEATRQRAARLRQTEAKT